MREGLGGVTLYYHMQGIKQARAVAPLTLAGDVGAVHTKPLRKLRKVAQHEGAGRGGAVPQHQRRRVRRPAHRNVRSPEAGAAHPALLVGKGQGRQGGIIEATQPRLADRAGIQRGWRWGRPASRIARHRPAASGGAAAEVEAGCCGGHRQPHPISGGSYTCAA